MADLLHLVDKPEGWTSHDAVARMRSILGERRVGHAGTLDPFATGLLLVGEGKATALMGCLSLLPKRYRARVRLGVTTDTQDRTGATLRASDALPTRDALESALGRFRGPLMQRPPIYSAVRVRGERLYMAARRGEDVERPERPVHVYDLTLLAAPFPDFECDATVSRGTYVRTLAHDVGEALGCGAHLVALRRTASGPHRVEDALSPDAAFGLDARAFRERALSPARAVAHLPRMRLGDEETARVKHGASPPFDEARIEPSLTRYPLPPEEPGWPLALLDPAGDLVALGRAPEEQRHSEPLRLLRVFAASAP